MDNKSSQYKLEIRKQIKLLKNKFSENSLLLKSNEIFDNVELMGVFQNAKNIFCYYSMNHEVQTVDFMKKWMETKNFYIPVVYDDIIKFKSFNNHKQLIKSKFGVFEPEGEIFTDYNAVDLIIVPGVAFDKKMNRIGYGKGFYDKFLSNIKAPKMGVCYEFQLLDSIPTDKFDIPMNIIVSENDIIW